MTFGVLALSNLIVAVAASLPIQDAQKLWEAGQRLEAIDTLVRTLAREPERSDKRRRLVQWEMQVHRYARALEHMEPLGDTCQDLRARALYHLADYDGALALLAATDLDQALMRIDALEALGRFSEAGAELDRALAQFQAPDARLFACQGRRLMRDQRAKDAVAAFRAALEQDPFNREALYGLGRALLMDGQRDDGLAAMRRHRELTPLLDRREFALRGLDLAPRHAPNLTALGDAERALGRLDAALRAYEDAARCAIGDEAVPNALRHARLLEEDRHDVAGAMNVLKGAAERTPSARLFVRMGDLRAAEERWRDALDLYRRASSERPDDAEILRRIEQAERALEAARERDRAK